MSFLLCWTGTGRRGSIVFWVFCLLTSYFRYEKQRDLQSAAALCSPSHPRAAFLQAIAGEISQARRQRRGFLLLVAQSKAGGPAFMPGGTESQLPVLREVVRHGDPVCLFEGRLGLILRSLRVDVLLLLDRLLDREA